MLTAHNYTQIPVKSEQSTIYNGLWTPSHTQQLYSSLQHLFPACLIQLIQSYTLHPYNLSSTISELSKSPYFFNIPNTNQFLFETDGRGESCRKKMIICVPLFLILSIVTLTMALLPFFFLVRTRTRHCRAINYTIV